MSRASRFRWMVNLWPPFLFSGIRVLVIRDDWHYVKVRLRRHWFNRNYMGTHFGGSLFAMADPFWMIPIAECLGRDYRVWDQAAEITFVTATREDVFTEFVIDESVLDEIRQSAANGEKVLRWFENEIKTANGEIVGRFRKQVYVRRKRDRG